MKLSKIAKLCLFVEFALFQVVSCVICDAAEYRRSGTVKEPGIVETSDGNVWKFVNDEFKKGDKVVVTFFNMGTVETEDDIIVSMTKE